MHLTQVNAQVPGMSGSASKHLLSQWHLPRVGSAMPHTDNNQAPVCGTSAFAFQGTNAHIIQEQSPLIVGLEGQQSALQLAWQRQRHWVAPPLSPLIVGAVTRPGSAAVVMQADLLGARAAFLQECCVGNHAVLLAAGFLELCSSAAAIMSHKSNAGGMPNLKRP